jgi:hypothetical protein
MIESQTMRVVGLSIPPPSRRVFLPLNVRRVLILVLSLQGIQRTVWCVESSNGPANPDEEFD